MESIREIGGRQFKLKYTFNSICAMEEMAQMPLEKFMGRMYSSVRLLFWGALLELQPEITLREAGEIIGNHVKAGGSIDEVALLCSEALSLAGFAADEK